MTNQYYAGVVAFLEGDLDVARAASQRALQLAPASPPEQDTGAFIAAEARRVLALLSQ